MASTVDPDSGDSRSTVGIQLFSNCSPQFLSFILSFFVTGFALDLGSFLFGAHGRLACARVRFAFSGSGKSAVGPFPPGQ